jgi:AraC-like DNA-binding protein
LAITGLSPLQYQKQLRLQEARQLLLAGEHRATDVAFAVGYESASQFSREYLRQFGVSPARDVRQIRQAIGVEPTSTTLREFSNAQAVQVKPLNRA